MLHDMLEEEIFFFMYHMRMPEHITLAFEPYRRKWMIHRYIEQKKRESDEIEKAKKRKK